MKLLFLLLGLSLKLAAVSCCSNTPVDTQGIAEYLAQWAKQPSTPKRTALRNVRVFNDHGITNPTTVIIDGPRIGLIGSNVSMQVDQTIDCSGKYLIPGLFDSHIHPGKIGDMIDLTRHGITTGIGASCSNASTCAQLKHLPGLASFITAGPGATSATSSNPYAFPGGSPPNFVVNSTAQAPQWVAESIGNGSELIKIRSIVGGLSKDIQTALIAEAHKYNLFTMTHATDSFSWNAAIESHTDLVHHSLIDGPLTDDMVQRLAGAGTYNVPTLAIFGSGQRLGIIKDSEYATAVANVKKLYDAGVPIMAGTDCHDNATSAASNGTSSPSPPAPWLDWGVGLYDELERMVAAGLSETYVLQGATSRPAKAFGFHDRGHVRSGLRADLVLLGGDPLVNISNVRRVERVWVAGAEFEGGY